MIVFWLAYLFHRLLSGIRNGMIYREGDRARKAVLWPTLGMIILPLIAALQALQCTSWMALVPKNALAWAVVVAYVLSGVCAYMAINRLLMYLPYPGAKLHTWTFFEQVCLSALWFLFGWEAMVAAILAVYPALIIQKAAINIFSGLRWNDERTDDPTGQTYSLPLGMITIAVPRSKHSVRFALAILSIILLFCVYMNYGGVSAALSHFFKTV